MRIATAALTALLLAGCATNSEDAGQRWLLSLHDRDMKSSARWLESSGFYRNPREACSRHADRGFAAVAGQTYFVATDDGGLNQEFMSYAWFPRLPREKIGLRCADVARARFAEETPLP